MSRIGKCVETRSRLVAKGAGEAGGGEACFNGYRVSFGVGP